MNPQQKVEEINVVLVEEMKKYLHYCQFQKELDGKTIIAYRTDLEQFITFMETVDNCMGKKLMNTCGLFMGSISKRP